MRFDYGKMCDFIYFLSNMVVWDMVYYLSCFIMLVC